MGEKNPLRNIIDTKYYYKGHIGNLRVDMVRFPSGNVRPREILEHKPCVAILPVTDEGRIVLIKQYRHAVDEEIFEIPAGIIEEGEEPRASACRELREETGFMPGKLEEIAAIYTTPGFCDEKIYVYIATELSVSPLQQDDDEFIRTYDYSVEELEKMIAEKKITDGKTLLAYYWYRAQNAR